MTVKVFVEITDDPWKQLYYLHTDGSYGYGLDDLTEGSCRKLLNQLIGTNNYKIRFNNRSDCWGNISISNFKEPADEAAFLLMFSSGIELDGRGILP